MRVVLQRVSQASVTVDGDIVSEIGKGFLILLGIEEADGPDDASWLVGKI
ncbi:D-aminoacyl-tRNA deacylase, partial [bacterium]|nr:D-aminoacyl-tRNA deacylase [bacterium]